jgi:tRNA A-37 threonylcarbamoyl transferase component Bud32
MTEAAPPPLPAVIGGKYRPLRLIARGGMGAVYEVVHANTGEHLALKLMLARSLLKPDLVERFRQEARIQSSVRSEHVVRVVDADVAPEIDGAPFLVMELLRGQDFERICEERRPTHGEVVDWLGQVGFALDKAHKERIVHRDLKPENIFLAEREDLPPIVKVLDFGVAKLIEADDDGSTRTGQILGTPRYMSPEQASGAKKISPAADRFALGLIAFRLLAGRHYFEGDNWVALLQTVTRGPTSAPSEMGCARGSAFDAWFARACALDPAMRFGSCAEQVEALATALAGASFAGRRAAWRSRRLLALGAVAGAFGVGAIVWSSGRARTSAPRANGSAALAVPSPSAVAAPAAVLPPPVLAPPDPRPAQPARAATIEPPPRHRRVRSTKTSGQMGSSETAKPETAKPEPAKPETAKPEPAKPEKKKDSIWEEP